MKVLLTGARGFLGTYINNELSKNNEVLTLSRNGAALRADIAKVVTNLPEVNLVVHCAGKAHSVPKTEEEKQAFFDINVKGTQNLLTALEIQLPNSFVFISSVAVYGCESGFLINENHPLSASDPYGQSKVQAEELISDWCKKHDVICSILRLPLLVGEKPPGNLGAMIRGIDKGYYFNIAGGKARKSMVLASDVAKIIPIVAERGGIYNLTDGYHPSFSELSSFIGRTLGKETVFNMPFWIANVMGNLGNLFGNNAPINSKKLAKITADLTFDDSKAKKELDWKPMPVLIGWK